MVPSGLKPGLRHTQSIRVGETMTAPALANLFPGFAALPPVLATEFLVALVESACMEALEARLAPGQSSVGVHVDISHSAVTPMGMTVTAEVELIAINRQTLRFRVLCRDDREVICDGVHDRAIIDDAKFRSLADRKRANEGAFLPTV